MVGIECFFFGHVSASNQFSHTHRLVALMIIYKQTKPHKSSRSKGSFSD